MVGSTEAIVFKTRPLFYTMLFFELGMTLLFDLWNNASKSMVEILSYQGSSDKINFATFFPLDILIIDDIINIINKITFIWFLQEECNCNSTPYESLSLVRLL